MKNKILSAMFGVVVLGMSANAFAETYTCTCYEDDKTKSGLSYGEKEAFEAVHEGFGHIVVCREE